MVGTSTNNSTYHIKRNGKYSSISGLLNHIPSSVSNLIINVECDIVQPVSINLKERHPQLQTLTITSSNCSPIIIDFQNASLYADGVNITVSKNVMLKNCFLFAGSCSVNGENRQTTYGEITINGSADYVFCSGYASGTGSISSINKSKLVINGNANFLFGGGFAVSGGMVQVTESSEIVISDTGNVIKDIHNGSYLVGSSQSTIMKTRTTNEGHICRNVFPDSFSIDNYGSSDIKTSELSLKGIIDGSICESKNASNRINSLKIDIPEKDMFKVDRNLHVFLPRKEEPIREENPPETFPKPTHKPKTNLKGFIISGLIIVIIILGWFVISNNNGKKISHQKPTVTEEYIKHMPSDTPTNDNIGFAKDQNIPFSSATPTYDNIGFAQDKNVPPSTPNSTPTVEKKKPVPAITPTNTNVLLIEPIIATSTLLPTVTSSATPIPTETASNIGIIYVEGQIGSVFYFEPDINGAVRKTIMNDEEVEIISGPSLYNNSYWYKIKDSNGLEGWILAGAIQLK